MFNKKINKDKIKTWFVTGASSGIGKELCTQLLLRGYNVVAVSRRVPTFENENALNLSVDVTDINSVKTAIDKAIKHFGSVDVLANIAGISSYQTLEEELPEKMRSVMETNYWGTYNTCYSLIKYFRERNNGTIVNCSSVMGLVPRAYGAAYCSSKHAIEGLTASLWLEMQKINCRVLAVEPGLFETEIASNSEHKFASEFDEYRLKDTNIIKVSRNYKNDITLAVNSIVDVVEKEKLPRRLMLGMDCIQRVKSEVKYILKDIKSSIPISNKIALKYSSAYLNPKNFKYVIQHKKYSILALFSKGEKKEQYKIQRRKYKSLIIENK